MTDEKTTWLPTILFDMHQLFGGRIALQFAAEFGGRRLYVPKEACADHRIAQVIGLDAMQWLVENYSTLYVMVPLGEHSSYNKRIGMVRRMVDDGETVATITRAAKCHERSVYRHRAKAKGDQGDLF